MASFSLCASVLVIVLVGALAQELRPLNLKDFRNRPQPDKNVRNFKVISEEERLFRYIFQSKHFPTHLGAYTFKNCADPAKEIFAVQNLTFGPDPISFPGTLTVSFAGQIKKTFDSPLKTDLYIARRVGSAWIKVPCIGSIGSCTYDDLCEMLSGITCPPPLVDHHIPCKCPFTQGTYTLPTTSFDVDAAVFPPGDYHFSANVTQSGNIVTCLDIHATFE